MSGWRNIRTAPKDGTEVIGYRPDQGVFCFRWATAEEFVAKNEAGDPIEDYAEDFECWWHDRWGWLEGECAPTHWMPFPNAPVSE